MSEPRARVVLDVATGRTTASARPLPDRPFHILLLGDFSGRAARASDTAAEPLHERRVVAVDRDDTDDVLARLRPTARLRLDGDNGPLITLAFETVDDFHPDRLLEHSPLLRSLLELREQARAGRAVLPPEPSPRPSAAGAAGAAPPRGGSLLDQILDDAAGPVPAGAAPSSPPPDELQAYIRRIVAPHLVPDADPRQTALAEQVEETLATAVRTILHRPEFQALESIWRGVSFLVRRLETGSRLKVFLLDVSREELAADLAADRPVENSSLYRLLSAATLADTPWAVLAGLYTFSGSETDTTLLARIGSLAQRLDAPFVAAAAPTVVGVRSFASEPEATELRSPDAAWLALRRDNAARYIGLALPRFLLRLPYDPAEEPVEQLALTEMTSPPSHDEYLWGNPALVCALLLGQAFTGAGWDMIPGQVTEVDNLPLHLYRDHGATAAKPCAEALLTDRSAARLLDSGLMPLLSQKDGSAVRVARFQSVAEPVASLAGAWDAAAHAR